MQPARQWWPGEILLHSDKGTMRDDRQSTIAFLSGVCIDQGGRKEALRQPYLRSHVWGATCLPSRQTLGGSHTLDCNVLFTWSDQKPKLLSKELVGTLSKQAHKGLLEKGQAWKRTGPRASAPVLSHGRNSL